MNVYELFAKIGLDTSEYESNLDRSGKKTNTFAKSLGTGLKNAAKVGAAAVTAVSSGIVTLGKIGVDYNMQMENFTTNFATMLGTQEAAVAKVEELKKFAASTPLSMADLAKGTQTLLAFGVASEDSTDILRMLGDIALGDAEKMQSLANAFGKTTASGKLTGEAVQAMIAAGWNPLLTISEHTGESMEQLQKRMAAGQISADDLLQAMIRVTTGTGQFAGGMEAASHTTAGLLSTLEDNARSLVGEVFMPISESMLSDVLPMAIDSIASLSDAFKENGIGGMVDAAGEIIENVIGKITEMLPGLLEVAVQIVNSLVTGIANNLPEIIKAGIDMIVELIKGIAQAIPQVLAAAPDIVKALVDGVTDAMPSLLDAGKAIVDGIWDGIAGAWDGLVSWFNGLWDGLFGNRNVNVTATGTTGKFAGGIDYVPTNNFVAGLHRGEMVLTQAEANEYRKGGRGVESQPSFPSKIVVQSVLDGKVIGESAYNYMEMVEMAVG